jgi:hypothetical protein
VSVVHVSKLFFRQAPLQTLQLMVPELHLTNSGLKIYLTDACTKQPQH